MEIKDKEIREILNKSQISRKELHKLQFNYNLNNWNDTEGLENIFLENKYYKNNVNDKNNIIKQCEISKEEALFGCSKNIKYTSINSKGEREVNQINIEIPKDIEDEQSIILYNCGNYIKEENRRSDLVVKIKKEHFTRKKIMTQEAFFERYVVGGEGNLEDAKTQKLWVEYGFAHILIDSIDVITDKEVINTILDSELWRNKKYQLKEGKILNIKQLGKQEIVEYLYEISIEFLEKNRTTKHILKGIGDINKIGEYIDQDIKVIIEIQEDDNLRFCCFLKSN